MVGKLDIEGRCPPAPGQLRVCPSVFLVLWAKLRKEEEWMRSQFGETYATYAHQTAALVPYLF